VAFGATDGAASVSAGKYIADDVYLQVGAGGTGGVGAQVEWEPKQNLSVTSGAQANGDTRIAVRWKKDY
jgi:translocation and assembly module TamB